MQRRDLALDLGHAHDRDAEPLGDERHRVLSARETPGDERRVVPPRLEPRGEVRDVDRRPAHVQARDDAQDANGLLGLAHGGRGYVSRAPVISLTEPPGTLESRRSTSLAFPADAVPRHRCGRVHRLTPAPHAPEPRSRRRGLGRVHRLLRPCAQGGERAADCRSSGSTSSRTRSTSPATTACSTSPGSPGCRSFGGVFPTYVRRNILASQRLFEAAAAAGARVALASSSSIYGDAETYPTTEDTVPRPISPYGITKLASEHLARAYGSEFGLHAVVLRYFTIFGPRQRPDMAFTRMVTALADGSPFELYGDGTQSRSFTYVDDVVEATIAALERAPAGSVYNVGGGEEVSMLRGDRGPRARRGPPTRGRTRATGRRRCQENRRGHVAYSGGSGLESADAVRGGARGSMALGR